LIKIIVIVVVALILIPVVIAVAWFVFAGLFTTTEEQRTTVNMASPEVFHRSIAGDSYWDVTIAVNRVTPRDSDVPWTDLRIVVKATDGHVLNLETRPQINDPSRYDDGSDGSVDVEFWYVEITQGDTDLSTADTIRMTGLSSDYEGALVQLNLSDELIGSIVLPTNFP
jgi:hypothetical protein